ncbi:MAG: MBL fold metallo-hydrolase [Candidatus Diapherotrites archaeon]|nr:MBL fold metallo-hydrolase [Candidatus Diapherotrites archaeon]
MANVIVLVKGYARKRKGIETASPSSVLIEERGKRILVDPGSNAAKLLTALKKNRISKKSIDSLFLTHFHADHLLNISRFPDVTVLADGAIWSKDTIVAYGKFIPKTGIRICKTPGHCKDHESLLVKTAHGIITVAGDVFWWNDDEAQQIDLKSLLSYKDPYATDMKALRRSRRRLLKEADLIIPGHGKMFASPIRKAKS